MRARGESPYVTVRIMLAPPRDQWKDEQGYVYRSMHVQATRHAPVLLFGLFYHQAHELRKGKMGKIKFLRLRKYKYCFSDKKHYGACSQLKP